MAFCVSAILGEWIGGRGAHQAEQLPGVFQAAAGVAISEGMQPQVTGQGGMAGILGSTERAGSTRQAGGLTASPGSFFSCKDVAFPHVDLQQAPEKGRPKRRAHDRRPAGGRQDIGLVNRGDAQTERRPLTTAQKWPFAAASTGDTGGGATGPAKPGKRERAPAPPPAEGQAGGAYCSDPPAQPEPGRLAPGGPTATTGPGSRPAIFAGRADRGSRYNLLPALS